MSRPSKLPQLLAAIAELEARGVTFSLFDVERLAFGEPTGYLSINTSKNPVKTARAAYQEAITRLKQKASDGKLPVELLERLRDNKRFLEAGSGPSRNPEAMAEAAVFFGINKNGRGSDWWNDTLDALDAYDPNWRGYAVPVRQVLLQHEPAKARGAA